MEELTTKQELRGKISTSGKILGTLISQKGEKGDKGPQGEKGSSFIWKGNYNSSNTYQVNDAVFYLGSSYICVKESIGNTPTNSEYFNLMAKQGESGTGAGTGDMLKAIYDIDGDGVVDNALKIDGHTVKSDVPSDAKFTDTQYTAGEGIEIDENNVIKNVQNAAEWGKITGDLLKQTDLKKALDNKVSVIEGKGLSSNDYSNDEKTKLEGIEEGAEANVKADWNSTEGSSEILNKPNVIDNLESTSSTDILSAQQGKILKEKIEEASQTGGILTGSIVAYDGDTIPEGYEEVDNPNVYSAEEKVIGEWFGKPLYRKVITGNMPKTQISGGVYAEYVQTGLSNCKIRNFYGMCHQENGEQSFPFPITNNDNIKNQVQALFPNCSQLTLTSFFNWNGYIADITLEYTKTTD